MSNRDCCNNWVGYDNYNGYALDGIIDEVRISSVEQTDFDHKRSYTYWSWSHPAVVKLIVNEGPTIVSTSVSSTELQQWYVSDTSYSIRGDTIGYWGFDEGYGNRAYDNGYGSAYFTISGGEWVKGYSGTAVQLDGDTDYIDMSNYAYKGQKLTELTADNIPVWKNNAIYLIPNLFEKVHEKVEQDSMKIEIITKEK